MMMAEFKKEFSEKDAFAAFSMPGSRNYTLLWSNYGRVLDAGAEKRISSFVVQTFDHHSSEPFLIPADEIGYDCPFSFKPSQDTQDESTEKGDYLLGARETISAIRNDEFIKVVLSKIKVVDRGEDDIYDLYKALVHSNRKAFVFLYHIPGEGLWCGASPEILLKDVGHSYQTMALAATQPDLKFPLSEVDWGNKEIHEQHVIETFIEGKLDDVALRYSKKGPRTVKAGSVLHICSDYFIEKRIEGLSLAEHLHPGPAICGLPQSAAIDWIRSHEMHAREHYCGYMGPWMVPSNLEKGKKDSALFINLRSMSVWRNAYVLYLGGGLTAQSNAKLEWEETELKSSTMMNVIASIHHV